MAQVTRNSFKGYTYQQYVFTLMIAMMDVRRDIRSVESEAEIKENFDDLCVVADKVYRVQVKNYQNVTIDDIRVENGNFIINANENAFNSDDNNVVFINTDRIDCNTTFLGIEALLYKGLTIVPLVSEKIEMILGTMYNKVGRENQIVQFAYKRTITGEFITKIEDLPEIIKMSTDLENETIILRTPIDIKQKGITWIVGKPGIGKSHYVNELMKKHKEAILYRFWIGSMDENLRQRLSFDVFLDELALNVFESPRSYTYNELVEEINSKGKILIIDGLDHVENYNNLELDKYVDFLCRINEASVVLLSRPLRESLNWAYIELINWSYDETNVYLNEAHAISDFYVVDKIYSIAKGYPIITYFLAEHYKLTGEISLSCEIDHINCYYDELLRMVEVKQAMSIFATNNSFFLESELKDILNNELLVKIINDFIEAYPYLFNRTRNRVSLLHDSLNTYLRENISDYEKMKALVNNNVICSLENLEVRYMARMSSFELDDKTYKALLLKYCKRDSFDKVLANTVDFESVANFYKQLQRLLEKHEHVYDIYQYYSFALIYQMVNRNDLIDQERLIHETLRYMKNNGDIEEEIFSTGIIWYTYLLLKTERSEEYVNFLESLHHMPKDIYEELEKELYYYEHSFDVKEDIIIDKELADENKTEFEKQDIIIEQMISTWINNVNDNGYYTMIERFLKGDEKQAIEEMNKLLKKYNVRENWSKRVLKIAKYKLNELGCFGENNIFRSRSLAETIEENSCYGSFSVYDYVLSYIRLANIEDRRIDIFSINRLWIMYYEHKDYSVVNIDEALLVFERKKLIKETESIEIIKSAMEMSDKGIRHLLSDYIDKKPIEYIKTLEDKGKLSVDVLDLNVEYIDQLEEHTIELRIQKLIEHSFFSKSIDFWDIRNLLKSKWSGLLLRYLSICERGIRNVDINFDTTFLDKYGVLYDYGNSEEKKDYTPFEHGCIHESDYDYILENQVGFMEVSRYLDGWYTCFPYVEVYLLYEKEEIKENYINIIHSSMFARMSKLEYIGSWYLMAGNIPRFLDLFEVEIDWAKLFEIFEWFIKSSLIY